MIQNIFSVITDQWQVVLGILVFIALCQILIIAALQIIFDKQLTFAEYLTLSMSGWILPASFISSIWFLFGFKPAWHFSLFLLISLLIILILFLVRLKPTFAPDSKPMIFFLLLFFSVSVLLRLAFVSKVLLPSYFDSASHYQLIQSILGNNATILFTSLSTNYYHLGYHILAAFLTTTLQADTAKVMLILGQVVLALLPVSIFFMIRHETKSNTAGVFAVIVAAYGWYMPAHAVDWGKYPALISVALIPFVLSLAYLVVRHKNILSPQKRWGLYLLLGFSILISGFIHSRSLVIYGIVFIAWLLSTWQQKLSSRQQAAVFFIVIVAIIVEIIFIQQHDVLLLLFDPYIKGALVTVFVLLLSVFTQRSYPQLILTCILIVGFLLGSLFIPVQGLIPGHDNLTLLDRPFVEMFLFLPLSLLGGWGLAGLEKFLQDKNLWLFSSYPLISLALCGVILVHAFFNYDPYPSPCCVLAGNDDVTAIDWIANKLPMNAHIGISATELNVLASGNFEGYVGGDAGIWITPLINRGTAPLLYDTDFTVQATLDSLCQQNINYLYVGSLGYTFDDAQLSARPDWYKMLLSMPKVRVYQVVGCK